MTNSRPYVFRALYEWIIDNETTPYILVDVSIDKVSVPEQHIKNGQIILNISPMAVYDLQVDNDAVVFSASFSGISRQVYVPLSAVMAIYAQESEQGIVFEHNMMVSENMVMYEHDATKKNDTESVRKEKAKPTPHKRGRAHLRVVK